jgi:FAD/FMN-containing dehydrogenase
MLISQSGRLAELRARIDGRVVLPGDEDFRHARQAFNLMVDQAPAAVVEAANVADVAATVRYAADHGLRVAPQGTGHNAGPLRLGDDVLLLRTGALDELSIDAERRSARAGAGLRWGAVADAASDAGLAPLSGSSPTVGVAGYSLGGGFGWLGRRHGLQTNAVTAIELVTADGQLRRVDADNDSELFWALRGGGGNFGVVTALEFDLFETPEVYAGALFFPFERAGEVMQAWYAWSHGLPEEVGTTGRVVQVPDLPELPEIVRGKSFAVVQVAYLGDESAGAEIIRPLVELGPEMNTFAMVPPAALGYLAMDPEDPMPYASAAAVLGDPGSLGIDKFVAATGPGSGSTMVSVELRLMGGALARSAGHHGARATLAGSYLMFAVGLVTAPDQLSAVTEQAEGIASALAQWAEGSYANFVEVPSDARGFYDDETWRRLLAVRAKVDPDRLFRANHEVAENVS